MQSPSLGTKLKPSLVAGACLTVLAVGYSSAVFYHLRTNWDVGLRCFFSDDRADAVRGAGPLVQWTDSEALGPDAPQRGDHLLRLAGESVPTVLHFQQRQAEIRPPAPVSDAGLVTTESDIARLPPEVSVAQVGERRYVRVEFQRPGVKQPLTAWLRLRPTPASTMLASLVWFALELGILLIGVLVFWRRPGDGSAALFFGLCGVSVVAFIGGFHWPVLVGTPLLVYPFVFCALLVAPLTLHFYLLFPRPLGVVRRRPATTLATIYAWPAVWLVAVFGLLLRINWLFGQQAPFSELETSLDWLGKLLVGYLVVSGLMFLSSFIVLWAKRQASRTPAERNQVRWLLGATGLATIPLLYLLWISIYDRAEFAFGPWPKLAVYVVSLIFTVAYAVSITRYKLLAVGEIVNRGIVYVAISFVATALFCLLVGLATAMVGTYYFRWENAVMAGTTAMVVAVSLGWIRDRFQRAIDVRFQRENYRLDIAVRRLSDAVDHLVEPAQLARQLMQSAQDTIGSSAAAVYLRDASHDHFELACQNAWPQAPRRLAGNCPLVVDLAARSLACDGRPLTELSAAAGCVLESEGSAVGLVLLGPKISGKALASDDRTFLLALARTAALALRGTQGYRTINSLKEDLQQKVQKIAEQQRRIMILQGELLNRGAGSSAQPVVRPPTVELKHELRGSGPAVRQLLAQVAKIADSPSSVLIRGESGTGKELLAQAIHQNSPRAGKPFVQVHCAALSAGLLESELFGHVRGAFTGADRDRAGRFELADGGTLFLDEVGDINLETQTKLLRVLQERAFERVGGMTTLEVDVRLITATHQNLEALMRTGRFREDLFYRLNVISLRSPSLRERREDIFELALYFLQLHAARCGKRIARIDDDAVETLMDYGWPGNVRQLENAIERAVVLAEGETIGIDDLPPEIIEPSRLVLAASSASFDAATSEREASSGLDQTLALVERERLVAALAECGGNKSQAARRLGIPRTTLFSKLRRHGLE